MKFQGTGFYVKNHAEMARVFKDAPDVLQQTLAIAERCSVRLQALRQQTKKARVRMSKDAPTYRSVSF